MDSDVEAGWEERDEEIRGEPPVAVAQLFDWTFSAIEGEVCSLADIGFTHVHVSPPQQSNPARQWWGRYQPDDFRAVRGPLGTEADFVDMVQRAEECGVTVVADVVLNHTANFGFTESNLYYPRGCRRDLPVGQGPAACLFRPEHFYPRRCIGNYGDHCEVLNGRICGVFPDQGLPDLETGRCEGGYLDINARNYDPYVFEVAKEYLLYLQDLGVRAFRFDAAKHMHPAFLEDLLRDPDVSSRTNWAYAEIIADSIWDPSMAAYRHLPVAFMDFPLTRSLQRAFGLGGNLGSLEFVAYGGRSLPTESSVSFVTNHDVWGNAGGLGYRFGDYTDERLAHMFVLGRAEGIPYIYSEFTNGPSSRERAPGEDYVLFHRRPLLRAMMSFRVQMMGENQGWRWQDPVHLAFARGQRGFVAINKSTFPWDVSRVDARISDGSYRDLLSGRVFSVVAGRVRTTLPSRSGLMLVRIDG